MLRFGKMRRPSGTWMTPRLTIRVERPGELVALEADRAAERAVQPRDVVVQRGLADAVAAQDGHDLALADVEIDAAQDLDLAVAGTQAADFKHGTPPALARSAAPWPR